MLHNIVKESLKMHAMQPQGSPARAEPGTGGKASREGPWGSVTGMWPVEARWGSFTLVLDLIFVFNSLLGMELNFFYLHQNVSFDVVSLYYFFSFYFIELWSYFYYFSFYLSWFYLYLVRGMGKNTSIPSSFKSEQKIKLKKGKKSWYEQKFAQYHNHQQLLIKSTMRHHYLKDHVF